MQLPDALYRQRPDLVERDACYQASVLRFIMLSSWPCALSGRQLNWLDAGWPGSYVLLLVSSACAIKPPLSRASSYLSDPY